ncbi:hypothetical protein RRG08_064370 [Elysia crispata]|uniref:Uncharacterized protein n=1 Tax=Elysia crispata TaxID=231223 RepID=A0AAE1AEJ2_9GAST|nr:hypothetical protein RRG08_064370 [Elysia crispata]
MTVTLLQAPRETVWVTQKMALTHDCHTATGLKGLSDTGMALTHDCHTLSRRLETLSDTEMALLHDCHTATGA